VRIRSTSVIDPKHYDSDPDPSFRFDPYPTFHFHADPGPAPRHSDEILRPLVYRVQPLQSSILSLRDFIVSVRGPSKA
jgi:hypothetical protein